MGASEEEPQEEDEPAETEGSDRGARGEEEEEEEEGGAGEEEEEAGEEVEQEQEQEQGEEPELQLPVAEQQGGQTGDASETAGAGTEQLLALAKEVALLKEEVERGREREAAREATEGGEPKGLGASMRRRWSGKGEQRDGHLLLLATKVKRWGAQQRPKMGTYLSSCSWELKFIHIVLLLVVWFMWVTQGFFSPLPAPGREIQHQDSTHPPKQEQSWWGSSEYGDAYQAYKISRGPYRRFFDFVDQEASTLWSLATSMVQQQHGMIIGAPNPHDVFTSPPPVGAPNLFAPGYSHRHSSTLPATHTQPYPAQQSAYAQHANKSVLLTVLALGGMVVTGVRTTVGGIRAVRGVATAVAGTAAAGAAQPAQERSPFA